MAAAYAPTPQDALAELWEELAQQGNHEWAEIVNNLTLPDGWPPPCP